jgi:phage terminase large subunit GpA-like protein
MTADHPNELALIALALARGIRPPEALPFSAWLPKNIVLVDGPLAGEMWSADHAPYLPEIADCLSDDDPCNLVTVRKSQQSGASILALAWCLYIAEREPANTLYGVPGIDALRDMNSGKLQPLIDGWQKHIKRDGRAGNGSPIIVPQTSRSSAGSTTYEKVFPGGRLWLANANAVMDLSSKTAKKGIKDEVSKWQDIPGFGDPENLFFGRFTAFRRTKSYKILEISTPEVDTGDEDAEAEGHCRIDRSFRKSDQRFWNCLCPECGSFFVHAFDRLRIDEKHPHRTAYECECGHLISEAERVRGVRAGHWLARMPAPERHPGFHIDAFISLMMSYEAIAEDYITSRKSEPAKKGFSNLVLGLPYKFRGDAPDHARLMERREDGLQRGHVPPLGLILVGFADVQMRGIWFEVVAFSPSRESWTVEALYIDGDTSAKDGEAFQTLKREALDREFPDAFGRTRKLDALGIDSGYRSHIVYSFVRKHQRLHPETGRDVILACKGLDGWGRPALGQPSLVDIDLEGQKLKQGAKVWGIGTWPLKGGFYSDLHKLGVRSGELVDPEGYCHFGNWLDEIYFRQLTAEHLENVIVRGRTVGRRWQKNGGNHFLDCRVGNIALAEYLGLSSMTDEQWARLATARGMPEEMAQRDLFTAAVAAPSTAEPEDGAERSGTRPASPPAATVDEWIGRPTGDWLKR